MGKHTRPPEDDGGGWWQVELRRNSQPITARDEAKQALAALNLGGAELDADDDGPPLGIWMVQIPEDQIPKAGDPARYIDEHYAGWTNGEYEIGIPLP